MANSHWPTMSLAKNRSVAFTMSSQWARNLSSDRRTMAWVASSADSMVLIVCPSIHVRDTHRRAVVQRAAEHGCVVPVRLSRAEQGADAPQAEAVALVPAGRGQAAGEEELSLRV